jgi:glycosyltransferase involved in cell wall biosynthesis
MASIDIVIPCYNYAHFLPECVESILSQGLDQVRVVIIDNASTDNSVEMAERLAAADGRIELVRHATNVGPHASFNEGVDLARADYFMILCADDLLAPGALRLGVAVLDGFPDVSVVFGAKSISAGNAAPATNAGGWTVMDGDAMIEACCRRMKFDLTAHAMLVRTSAQKAVGHYRSSIPLLDDLEMALRLARGRAVAELSMPLATLREHTSNISQVMWHDGLRRLREYETVWESFFAHEGRAMPNAQALLKTVRHHLAAAAYWSAVSQLVRGKRAAASDLFAYGRRLDPVAMRLPPVGHLLSADGSLRRARRAVRDMFVEARPRFRRS